ASALTPRFWQLATTAARLARMKAASSMVLLSDCFATRRRRVCDASLTGGNQLPPGPPALLVAHDLTVECVALDRDAAGLRDQPPNLGDAQLLRRVAAGVVVDLLVHDRTVEVV